MERVISNVETGAIIKRLNTDAKNGSTHAARELREWLNRVEVEGDSSSPSVLLTRRATKHGIPAALLADRGARMQQTGSSKRLKRRPVKAPETAQ